MITAITRAAFAGLALCLVGCSKAKEGAAEAAGARNRRRGHGDRQHRRRSPRRSARSERWSHAPGHAATLSAPAAGRVANILVTSGQSVRVGQTLVELDQAPFQAALQSANAALAVAERANERQQRLAQEGIVPRKDAEAAAAEVARARAEAVAARRIEQLSILRSPINGVVTRMSATLGASVDPAVSIVEISDPTALDLLLSVTPTRRRTRAARRESRRSARASRQTGEPLGIGTVLDVAGDGRHDDAQRRRPRAGSDDAPPIANRRDCVRRDRRRHRAQRRSSFRLEALVPDGEEFKVFVVDANTVAHEREVKVGGRTSTVAEILEGLTAGERVVTYGAYGVADSAKVVRSGDSAKAAVTKEKP